jgi:hypothetical protein
MERPGWSEMYWIFWGQEVLLLILWHSSISVWRIILIISGLFFRKSLRYHHLYFLIYGKHFEVRRIDLFMTKLTMIMFRLSVINPSSLSGYWFIVRGSSCGNPITGEANLFLILSPISPFHCWSSIITEMLLTFPVVF